jgi:Ni/Co efflux regulator RcnB
MNMHTLKNALHPVAFSLVLALCALPALAEKPAHAGGGKPEFLEQKGGGKPHKGVGHDEPRRDVSGGDRTHISVNLQIGGYFTTTQRRAVVDYYEPRFKAGKCPPGLAKKNNGCMPPGLAKQWRKGYPLPHDVVYYPVPDGISIRLGLPPEGHKFVRVATDILLIAVGTGMVIDAIDDLSRL